MGIPTISLSEEVTLVCFPQIPADVELLSDIFTRFAQGGINIDMVSQASHLGSFVDVSFTCADSDMVKILEITNQLSSQYSQLRPMVSAGNAKINIEAESMTNTPGIFATAISSVSKTAAHLKMITTSDVDISFLVDTAHAKEAANALQQGFQKS